MTKRDQVSISINGEEIKPCSIPLNIEVDCYSVIIDRIENDIFIRVKNWEGNEIEGDQRIDILKDILPRVIEALS